MVRTVLYTLPALMRSDVAWARAPTTLSGNPNSPKPGGAGRDAHRMIMLPDFPCAGHSSTFREIYVFSVMCAFIWAEAQTS